VKLTGDISFNLIQIKEAGRDADQGATIGSHPP
jgi:hypothetical protein